jgi:hypothetical protein
MAIPVLPVKPGDLITSTYMNEIVDKLLELDTRVTTLEQGTTTIPGNRVTIIDVTSSSATIRVGSRVSINGSNFLVPPSLNRVTVGSVPIDPTGFSFGSSDQHLIFDLPSVPALSPGGSSVTFFVDAGPNGTASKDVMIFPAIIVPAGRVEVAYTTPPVMTVAEPNITAGRSYIFTYRITAFADMTSSYNVIPTMTGNLWTVEFLEDAADTVRATNTISISGGVAGVNRDIRLRVNVPGAGGAAAGTLDVRVENTAPGTRVTPGSANPVVITTGNPPPTPETRVRISLANPAPVAGRVACPRSVATTCNFTVTVTSAATVADPFLVSATLRNSAGWSAPLLDTTQFAAAGTPAAPANQNVAVDVTPGVGATNTDLLLRVRKVSDNIDVQYALPVSVT